MQVLRDPFPFVDDRESLQLLVQSRILHRDPGVEGEGLDERPIFLAELVGPDPVGEV